MWAKRMVAEERMDSITQSAFEQNLDKISAIIGGCERIASNPIPYAYSVLLHRTVYIYCLLLPFGLVDTTGWMMPVLVVFIGYSFVALEAIVRQIEDPFGTEPNDLPLTAICETIENSLLEMTGQALRPVSAPHSHISY
jgi:putative membrane protein